MTSYHAALYSVASLTCLLISAGALANTWMRREREHHLFWICSMLSTGQLWCPVKNSDTPICFWPAVCPHPKLQTTLKRQLPVPKSSVPNCIKISAGLIQMRQILHQFPTAPGNPAFHSQAAHTFLLLHPDLWLCILIFSNASSTSRRICVLFCFVSFSFLSVRQCSQSANQHFLRSILQAQLFSVPALPRRFAIKIIKKTVTNQLYNYQLQKSDSCGNECMTASEMLLTPLPLRKEQPHLRIWSESIMSWHWANSRFPCLSQ